MILSRFYGVANYFDDDDSYWDDDDDDDDEVRLPNTVRSHLAASYIQPEMH